MIFKRGARPISKSLANSFGTLQLDVKLVESVDEVSEVEFEEERFDSTKEVELADEMDWARVVAPPLKRSGHIILEVCASNGQFATHSFVLLRLC